MGDGEELWQVERIQISDDLSHIILEWENVPMSQTTESPMVYTCERDGRITGGILLPIVSLKFKDVRLEEAAYLLPIVDNQKALVRITSSKWVDSLSAYLRSLLDAEDDLNG